MKSTKPVTGTGVAIAALNAAHRALCSAIDALPLDSSRTTADQEAFDDLNAALADVRSALTRTTRASRASGAMRQREVLFVDSCADTWFGTVNGADVMVRKSSLGPGEKLIRKNVNGKILIMVESYGGAFRYPPVIFC